MFWVLIIVGMLVSSLWLGWRLKNAKLLKAAESFLGPPTIPGLGNALEFMCNPQEFVAKIRQLMDDYGEFVRFWLGPDLNIIVSNPEDLKNLLMNPKITYKGPLYKYMRAILGGGILSGSGQTWRKHRQIANPAFSKRAVENFNDVFNKEADLLIQGLGTVPQDKQFDIYDFVVKHTTYAVCQTVMGLTREQTLSLPNIQAVIDMSPKQYDIVFFRMTKWYLQIDPYFWMSTYHKEQKIFLRFIDLLSSKILNYRREHLSIVADQNKKDLLNAEEDVQMCIIDKFIMSEQFNEEELIKETFTLFTASQEATGKIVSYLLLMMAYHPQCQDKLYQEIVSVYGDSDRYVTDEDFKNMPYLEMVFKEVLRLFPIGAMLQRTVLEDVQTTSGTMPAGCSLVVPVYHLHRDKRFWENPQAFDPERFSPENVKLRHPNCYIPFSMGPMDCLGRYFASKVVKNFCVRILREFQLSSPNKYEDLRLMIAISVAPIDGYKVKIKRRPTI